MRTRGEGYCTGTNSGTGIGSVVGSSCLLTVTFGLDHGVLTDLEKEIMRNGCSVDFLF